MPAYQFEFETETGPENASFTIDDDRPLAEQVRLVLDELRQRGSYIKGGADHELAVEWDGRTIDLGASPAAEAMNPTRPIRLVLRRRERTARINRTEPPPERFVTRGTLAIPTLGLWAGTFGWILGASVQDWVPHALPAQQDLIVATVLGGILGAAVVALSSWWRAEPAGLTSLLGGGLGLAGGALGSLLGGVIAPEVPLLGSRPAQWAVLGCLIGGAVGLRWAVSDARRIGEGMVGGGVAGVLGGLVALLPGPTDLWLATAASTVGFGVAYGIHALSARRSPAVLRLVALSGRAVGVLKTREWTLGVDQPAPLWAVYPGERSRSAGRLRWGGGRVTFSPVRGVDPTRHDRSGQINGTPATEPTPVLNGDVVKAGVAEYRLLKRFGVGK